MAEKNTESTAVNELIELVATAQPLPPDPSEDLMFTARKPERSSARKVSAPRMTSTMPGIRGAAVDPLPRTRAPVGTQQGLPAVQQTIKAVPPGVRVSSSSPPSRPVSLPPLTLDEHDDEDAEVTNPGPATFSRPTTQGFAAGAPVARATGSQATRRPSAEHPSAEPIASRVTKPTLPPPVPTMRASSPPMTRPSTQPTSSFSYPVVPQSMPVAAPYEPDPIASILEPGPERRSSRASASWLEQDIGTQQVAKKTDWKVIAGKLIGPMVILVIAGIFIGGYFAFDGDGGKKRTPKAAEGQKITMPVTSADTDAKAEVAAPVSDMQADVKSADVKTDAPITPPNLAATTPEPANVEPAMTPEPAKVEPAMTPEPAKVEPAKDEAAKVEAAKVEPPKAELPKPASTGPAPTTRPTLVDVRIDSHPVGATVMLIDRGKQSFLGTTPMSAAVDVSRKYELVFSYEGRATVVEALDPSVQKKLSVRLSRSKSVAVVAPRLEAPRPKAEKKLDKPAVETAKLTDKPVTVARGEGTLMISSKPPCEIIIDNKPTGLTTPQRAIVLPAGAHKITLVNTAEGIKKTMSVQVTADKPTKVIQDFMK